MSEDITPGLASTSIFATVKGSWGPTVVAKIVFSAGNREEYCISLRRICNMPITNSEAGNYRLAKEQSPFSIQM